jgi:hypothetical protein
MRFPPAVRTAVQVAMTVGLGATPALARQATDAPAWTLVESALGRKGALQAGGVESTARHNHLFDEAPHVIYMHASAHGDDRTAAVNQAACPARRLRRILSLRVEVAPGAQKHDEPATQRRM